MKFRLKHRSKHTRQTAAILSSLLLSLAQLSLNTLSSFRALLFIVILWIILALGMFFTISSYPTPLPHAINPFQAQTVAVNNLQYAQIVLSWKQLHNVQPRSAEINQRYLKLLSTSPINDASLSASLTTTNHFLSP